MIKLIFVLLFMVFCINFPLVACAIGVFMLFIGAINSK